MAINVIVVTVIVTAAKAVIPHSHREEAVEHHCMSAPVRGSAPVVSGTGDCPVIQTVIYPETVAAKP